MKIKLSNLGPIYRFDFDVDKDLNVIVGRNNIGKSYAITAVYLIIKNLISESFERQISQIEYLFYLSRREAQGVFRSSGFYSTVQKAEQHCLSEFAQRVTDELDVTEQVEDILTAILSDAFVRNLEQSFNNSFSSISSLQNKYSQEPLGARIEFDLFEVSITAARAGKLQIESVNLKKRVILKRVKTARKLVQQEDEITIYYNSKKTTAEPSKYLGVFNDIIATVIRGLLKEVLSKVSRVYFLPASRSGLYQALNAFSAVIAELSKSRTFLRSRIELPNISEPVSDYFLNLSNISSTKKVQPYSNLAAEIETKILEGQIIFNKDSKKIVYVSSRLEAELDLAFASSMISEIAPIVAYLKYVLTEESRPSEYYFPVYDHPIHIRKPASLLFIEEPEAHLHPEIQVGLMELFVKMCAPNLKIVMTTHSNYMFNKLTNMVVGKEIDFTKVGSRLMRMTDKGSIEDESAMKAELDGIPDENFADIAEKLYQERTEILDRLNRANAD